MLHDQVRKTLTFATECDLLSQVTVMHSMQAGYMDKAQKYTDKALMQIEKLKCKFLDDLRLRVRFDVNITITQFMLCCMAKCHC